MADVNKPAGSFNIDLPVRSTAVAEEQGDPNRALWSRQVSGSNRNRIAGKSLIIG